MTKAKKLIAHYKRIVLAADKAERLNYCWVLEKNGLDYTDEERLEMNQAQNKFHEATVMVQKIYEKKIGVAVVSEIRAWDTK